MYILRQFGWFDGDVPYLERDVGLGFFCKLVKVGVVKIAAYKYQVYDVAGLALRKIVGYKCFFEMSYAIHQFIDDLVDAYIF